MSNRVIRSVTTVQGGGWSVGECLNLSDLGSGEPFRPVERITLEKDVPTEHGMVWRVVVWDADGPARELPYTSVAGLAWEDE